MKNASWKNILRTALLAVAVGALPALAGPDNVGLGDGSDGALTVTTANRIVNVYAQVTGPLAPGDTAIIVGDATGIGNDDLVMVLQTTGIVPEPPSGGPTPIDLTNNPVGRWEFARVASVAGNTLNLTAPLLYSYAANVTQVIRVPEYSSLTINGARSISPAPWNGSTGGVVAFLVSGTFINFGSIDARGRGFRGALPVTDASGTTGCTGLDEPDPTGAQKGEGIAATRYGTTVTGRGRVGNGAGGGVCFKSGGGGGGNGGTGGQGGNTELNVDGNRPVGGEGGAALTFSLLDHLMMGAGGGAGHSTDVAAGSGGGIIFVRANALSGAGSFFANGNSSGSSSAEAASGGGAGGTVYLRVAGNATCGAIQANGGTGGSTGSIAIGPGGGGGGGRVLFQKGGGTCTLTGTSFIGANPGSQLDPGAPGGASYGATAGSNGSSTVLTGGFPVLPAPVVNTPADGSRTNSNTPTYSGTISITPALPAGTEIAIFVNGAEVGRVTPDALGNWTFTPVAPLAAGTHSVNAVAINTAQAVQSANSNTNTFIVDLAPPSVEVTTPAEGSRTNDTMPTYTGTVSDDAPGPLTVEISVDGTVLGNATVTGNTWTFTPTVPLLEGGHTVTATATDQAGNSASDSNNFTVDLTAPAVEVMAPAEGSRTSDTTPDYSGTVEAGSMVEISVDGTVLGNATVTGTTWTFTPTVPLLEGDHTVTATATDEAGNSASDSNTFTVDLTAPTVAVTTPAEGSRTSDTTPTYSGTVSDNGPGPIMVEISVDGTVLGNATVTGNTWTFTPTVPLLEGDHTVTATATDDVGNSASDSNTFTVDLTAPTVEVTTPAEGSRTNDTTPDYSGTVEAGSTVEISVDGTVLGTATVTGTTWTFTPLIPLIEGEHTVTATATDDVGNSASDSNTFTVDLTPPAVEVTVPAEGSRTNDTTPDYSGTVEAGSTVEISVDGTVLGNATVTGTTWTFTPTVPLAEGPHTVTATATDEAGNSASDSNTFTVDLTAPAAPVVDTPADGSTISDNTPTYSGTAEPGSTVTIIVDGTAVGTTTADASGNWSFTPVTGLTNGSHTVAATATDEAGNVSPQSNTNTFTVDATIPAAPVITGPADNTVTSDNTPTISGTAPPNSTVTVIVDGAPVGTTTSDAAGNWSFTPTAPLADGQRTFTATTTNAAGNTSPPSNSVRITIDTGAPDTTIVSGPSGNTESTSATFTFSSSETGVTYECNLDGAGFTPCTNPVTFEGLAEGQHTLQVRARDGAGNVDPSPATATWTVVRPTPPPAGDRDFLGDGLGCAASGGDPASLAMMGLGLLAVLMARRRRQ